LRPQALAAWLKGLDLLRERLLEHLAEEGIRPMETLGRAFDPHLHLALETAPPDPEHPAGTIVREARPGYLLDGAVLRYAEVVVAK
jgi:molecular chaperone GrpE